MPRDYYEILGVSRSSDKGAMKLAHRKLARQYHPDINKSTDAQERFNEIQEAYDVLSDEKKRKLYDQFGHAGVGAASPAGHPGGPFAGARPGSGFDFRVDDMLGGGSPADLFEQFFRGTGSMGGHASGTRRAAPRRNIEQQVDIPFDLAVRGGSLQVKQKSGPTMEIKIPKGIAQGAKLRIRGKGHPDPAGNGDLILQVRIAPHPYFRREANHLFIEVPISVVEALCGTTIDIPTLKGTASITIPAGTSPGTKLRLKGAGIEDTRGRHGDLFAVIGIDVPRDLSEEDRQRFRKLADQLPSPRRAVRWK